MIDLPPFTLCNFLTSDRHGMFEANVFCGGLSISQPDHIWILNFGTRCLRALCGDSLQSQT